MYWLRSITSFVVCVIFTICLNIQIGDIPPVGFFFDPFTGFWSNAEPVDAFEDISITSQEGIEATIYFDEYAIPHIYANDDYSLYYAQGYVTARDRLWQIDFQSRAGAGRLSEILGMRTLEYDRFQRRIGMPYGAKVRHEKMMQDPEIASIAHAYVKGINDWIDQLSSRNYPIEYKILGYSPQHLSTLDISYLTMNLSYSLSARNSELAHTKALMKFGKVEFDSLFPEYSTYQDPIVPTDQPFNFAADLPPSPDSLFIPSFIRNDPQFQPAENNGSNNWALAGIKTLSGNALLANDPHLTLSLPSIWYMTHLTSPNVNVLGVSFPGAPGVILGANENIAWGTTNSGADVMDWYEIKFRDKTLHEYLYEGKWIQTTAQIETINVKNESPVVDTLIFTHHGPVSYLEDQKPMRSFVPIGHALRWSAHDPSEEFKTIISFNRAQSYTEFETALPFWNNPAQNFIYADREGNIALWVTGKMAKKWKGQGQFLSDGTDADYEWDGEIPRHQLPHYKNPPRGFVSSANQSPADPERYPYYLGSNFGSFERGARINDRLHLMNGVTTDSLRILQTDNYSLLAEMVLPTMLKHINKASLDGDALKLYSELEQWNYYNNASLIAPTMFSNWFRVLKMMIWTDDFDGFGTYPSSTITADLILNSLDSKWFDNSLTAEKELLPQLAKESFTETLRLLSEQLGDVGDTWLWGNVNGAQINHLARIPGFDKHLFVGGGKESINAMREDHGPSWRMVAEAGDTMKVLGIYPGGQSGNPGSKTYDSFMSKWAEGDLISLTLDKKSVQKNYVYKIEIKQ